MTQPNVIDVVPVLDANILANNDVFMVAYEIPQVFNKGVARRLKSVVVLDTDDQNQAFDLIFSNATITLGTANAAITISDADAAKVVGSVRMVVATHAYDLINSTLFTQGGLDIIMQPSGTSNSLWVSGVVRSGTPTFTAAGMKIKLGFE
jgi:hypothetical protein